ncbi:MAG: beta-ketoacyl synthase N-terminal-like domain-containing protein [Phycisphaeraceae bacterium]
MNEPPSPSAAASRSNRARIVVAGLGLLTPLGHATWETFTALLAGRTLADRADRLPANVDATTLVRALGAVRVAQHGSSDPSIDLAERAAREAIFEAGGRLDTATDLPTFLGTSKGAVGAMTEAFEAYHQSTTARPTPDAHHRLAQLAPAVALGPHDHLSQQLQQRLNVPVHSHAVAACASSLTALHAARAFLQRSAPDHALVVTADAALLPGFIHSYRRLGVLAPLTAVDYRQRPLDARRRGFMLSEAGAAVLLKRLPTGEPPQIGQIELLDTAVAAETHDLIRPSPTMPALRHVAGRLFADRQIDMLHPHAPGTLEHDPTELAVYADALDAVAAAGGRRPDLYACKGAIGHSLGAAGLTAFVLACMSLRVGRRPAMPWLTEPMGDTHGFILPTAHESMPCSRTGTHAILAAGFAGHVAGAVVQRH